MIKTDKYAHFMINAEKILKVYNKFHINSYPNIATV